MKQPIMNEIYQVGSIVHQVTSIRDNPNSYRVYIYCGISPSLTCADGGGRTPYIVVGDYDV